MINNAKSLLVLLVVVLTSCSSAAPDSSTANTSGGKPLSSQAQQSAQVFENTKYLLYLPADFATSEKRWPIILYLHGKSLRGDDLKMLKNYGLAALLDQGLSIPFVVVSPQCPADRDWVDEGDVLMRLIDNISATYLIDQERIYVTGHSMGGRGTWFLASRNPKKFAAIMPLADAPTDDAWAREIAKVPAWTFHGTKDELASFERTEKFVNTLKKLGADVKLTPLPDRDHFILDTYENKEIYDWLLKYKRKT